MKVAIIFLSIFVALSLQYNRQRGGIRFPWLPFIHPAYSQYLENNRYYYGDNSPVGRFNPKGQIVYLAKQEDDVFRSSQSDDNYTGGDDDFEDNDARFKSSSSGLSDQPFSPQSEQNARFFFNLMNTNNAFNNPFIKTATFTLTSTATVLTIVTCIPTSGFSDQATLPCRRKRGVFERDLLSDASLDSQFLVNPTEVRLVMPTEEATLARDARQDWSSVEISSSKDAENDSNQLLRGGRLLFQNFVTGRTITTWLISSSNLTQTLMPTDSAGMAATLPCLPPGLVVCSK